MTTLQREVRLEDEEIALFKNSTYKKDSLSKLYLFGSRTKLDKRGGDIDLIILSDTITRSDVRDIRIEFIKNFGEQKIDIILDTLTPQKTFTKVVIKKAIEL